MDQGVLVTGGEDDGAMSDQLVLIEAADVDWRIDAQTKEIGLRGIAEARKALAEASRRAGGRPPLAA